VRRRKETEMARSATSRLRARWLVTGVAAALLTACGGGGEGDGGGGGGEAPEELSQAKIDEAMQTPTELTFWTWVPNIEKEVALFEKKYPDIDVKVVNAGQGEPQYTKLRTALEADEGAPDVVQIEFQYIPTFTLTESLLDLRPYLPDDIGDKFVDWTWQQVSGPNDEIWAVPQDSGPMGMLYREDIFKENGIEPPATWDEFADAARKLHEADPKTFITNLAPNQNGAWMGLLWQAGAEPFSSTAPEQISIKVNDEASQKVADYWQGLNDEGVIATDADFTDSWNQGLNTGRYATWLTAAWGPVFMQTAAPDTSGKWRAAPLPQWNDGDQVAGNWGGSTSAVVASSEHKIAAAKFAEFLNTDPESAKMMATEQFLFPVTTELLSDQEFLAAKPEFYGGQQVNQTFADVSDTVDPEFTWPPFLDQAVSDWDETVGKSLADKGDTVKALDEWQDRLVEYAKGQGFTVE
jgi:multiple sugar transport system substrate-binding protein